MDFTIASHVLLMAIVVGLVFHILLLLAGQQWNTMAILTAVFLVVAPLSVANQIPMLLGLKLSRIYITVLMVAVGILFMRTSRPGPATVCTALFLAFYILAGLWSDSPFQALTHKGLMLTVTFLSGVLLALTLRERADLTACMRIVLMGSLFFGLIVLVYVAMRPGQVGRLTPWGMNANWLGLATAWMLLLALPVALYDPVKRWKTIGVIACTILTFAMLASGSRGAILTAAIGGVFISLPLTRRPARLIAVYSVAMLLLWGVMEFVTSPAKRLTQIDFVNRQGVWNTARYHFADSPLIGQGWVYESDMWGGYSTSNLHSVYFNILAETGLMGMTLLVIVACIVAAVSLTTWMAAFRAGTHVWGPAFAAGLLVAIMAHGVGESAVLLGATFNPFILGFAVGLLDRTRAWMHQDAAYHAYYAQHAVSAAPTVGRAVTAG